MANAYDNWIYSIIFCLQKYKKYIFTDSYFIVYIDPRKKNKIIRLHLHNNHINNQNFEI